LLDAALDRENVARPHRPEPLQIVEADGAGRGRPWNRMIVDHADEHRAGVPTTRNETSEHALLRRLRVQVKGLRIKLSRKLDDLLGRDLVVAEAMRLPDQDVLEVDEIAHAGRSRRRYNDRPISESTISPRWLRSSMRLRTNPNGRVRDGQASSTRLRPVNVSPGRTGLSHRHESTPGEPVVTSSFLR